MKRTFEIKTPVYKTTELIADLPAYSKEKNVASDAESDSVIFRKFRGPLNVLELTETTYYDYPEDLLSYSISSPSVTLDIDNAKRMLGLGEYASNRDEFMSAMERFMKSL